MSRLVVSEADGAGQSQGLRFFAHNSNNSNNNNNTNLNNINKEEIYEMIQTMDSLSMRELHDTWMSKISKMNNDINNINNINNSNDNDNFSFEMKNCNEMNEIIENNDNNIINFFENKLNIENKLLPNQEFYCPFCTSNRPINEIFVSKLNYELEMCNHYICISCAKNWSKTCLEGEIFHSKWPQCSYCDNCTFDECCILKLFGSMQYHQLYQIFFNKSKLFSIMKEFNRIERCPNPRCNNIGMIDKGKKKVFNCNECEKLYCISCNNLEFNNLNDLINHKCDDYKSNELNGLNKLNNLYNKSDLELYKQSEEGKDIMHCPGCRVPVQKNEGCNHMTCLCGTHFCNLCGKKIDPKDPSKHFGDAHPMFDENDMINMINNENDIINLRNFGRNNGYRNHGRHHNHHNHHRNHNHHRRNRNNNNGNYYY